MLKKDLIELASNRFNDCLLVLENKGVEYRSNANDFEDSDVFEYFERASILTSLPQEKVLYMLLTKHLVSLSVMADGVTNYSLETWDEKITDSINYLTLLSLMVRERYGAIACEL